MVSVHPLESRQFLFGQEKSAERKIFTKRQASHAKPIARMSRQSVRGPIWLTTPSDTNPYALPKVANARLVMVSQLWSDWSSVIPHL
ncbi:hypothetical protein T07_5223 [Trichinella nelsoni]|uniref:Uncharacterized protein n=1 Tax=Trichinella nelsoni TaxID=6336 RepID=A0A0V0RS25_9BILA|nr:hypothetical protein T07_5223 [Trichinella nelsoni]